MKSEESSENNSKLDTDSKLNLNNSHNNNDEKSENEFSIKSKPLGSRAIESDKPKEVILPFPLEYKPRRKSEDIMLQVLLAMVPGILTLVFFRGIGVLVQLSLATATAVICEYLNGFLRKREVIKLYIYSSIVAGWILAISIPDYSPWWLIVVGCCFGLWVGKYVFGGTGMNIFNPAIVGFCFLYVSFAYYISFWTKDYVSIETGIRAIFQLPSPEQVDLLLKNPGMHLDAIGGATFLGNMKVDALQSVGYKNFISKGATVFDFQSIMLAIAWIVGGLYLIWQKTADWRISLFAILGFSAVITVFYFMNSEVYAGPMLHLIQGSAIFASLFVITDPITAATSNKGRIVYALLVGFLAAIIRIFSNMPDSWAFAILLGNICVPFIDQYTKTSYGDKI